MGSNLETALILLPSAQSSIFRSVFGSDRLFPLIVSEMAVKLLVVTPGSYCRALLELGADGLDLSLCTDGVNRAIPYFIPKRCIDTLALEH